MIHDWMLGFTNLLGYQELLFLALGIGIGLFVGVLPGIGGTTALVLLMPLTFSLEPNQALALAGGIMGAGPMGGAVTAILLNTPGTTASAVTCLDGFPLAQQGKAGLAIGAAASSNALGGLIGAISVLAVIPLAGRMIFWFGPPEFFFLAVLGLVLVASTTRGNTFRALISACAGVAVGTIGFNEVAGFARYTFGNDYLWDGVKISAALIGIFAIAEMAHLMIKGGTVANAEAPKRITGVADGLLESLRNWGTLLRGSLIGTFIGAIPGTGGTVASFLSYGMTVQADKHPESFGKGNIKGVIATEAAINAKDGSMLIPTLAFGIPGTPEMAVFMNLLILHGLQPGPLMLLRHQVQIYSVIWSITAACLIASLIGLFLARPLARLARVDVNILAPIIIAAGFIGAYALDMDLGDVAVTAVFSVIGYLMIRFGYPRISFVVAGVLGAIAERSFQQTLMMGNGSAALVFGRPACLIIIAIILATLFLPMLRNRMARNVPRPLQPSR